MKKIISTTILILLIFTVVGCSNKAPDVPVKDIVEDIKSQIAEDLKTGGVKEDAFKDGKLPGYMEVNLTSEKQEPFAEPIVKLFNTEDLEEGFVLSPMITIRSDMIIVLKAKDESKVENLKAVLEKQKEAQINTWQQYLPDQYEKVKNNITKTKGRYLIYITYDSPEKLEQIFDNALK